MDNMQKLLQADVDPHVLDTMEADAKAVDNAENQLLESSALEAPPEDIKAVTQALNKVLKMMGAPELPVVDGATKMTPDAQRALNMVDAVYKDWHDTDQGLSIEDLDKILGVDLLLAEIGTLSGREFKQWLGSRAPEPTTPAAAPAPMTPAPETVQPPAPDLDSELMRRM